MPERGLYIVIEGSDGTGKSLQAIRTSQHLAELGYDPLLVYNDETDQMEPVQEPGGTPTANLIRRRIKDKSISRTPWENVEWFTEARESIWHEAIRPALMEGRPVVTARSWISTSAYQGYGEGVSLEDIRRYTIEHVGEEYMNPDLVCILALQSERVRRARLAGRDDNSDADTFESMPEEFQQNMQNGYVRFAEDNGIEIVSADPSPDEVQQAIWSKIEPILANPRH